MNRLTELKLARRNNLRRDPTAMLPGTLEERKRINKEINAIERAMGEAKTATLH